MAADVVQVSYLKWPDHPHWQFAGGRLGEDEHGVWVGASPGAQMSRPGEVVTLGHAWVLLLPHAGSYTAIFNARPGHCAVYVDIATQPVWTTDAVWSIDLDLDIVVGWDGQVHVVDEDEFEAHQTQYGYPPALVAEAKVSCAAVLELVTAGREPFGVVGAEWLEQVSGPQSP